MQFVFPFLVFFVLVLLAVTFNTEPLLVLWRLCYDPNTRPERATEGETSS